MMSNEGLQMRQLVSLLALTIAGIIAPGAVAGQQGAEKGKPVIANPALIAFISVSIQSYPKGWGYASKDVEKTGAITGLHFSGKPDVVRVFRTTSKLTSEDMGRLSTLVAALHDNIHESTIAAPDQKIEGHMSVVIHFRDGKTLTVNAMPDKKFEPSNIQAIWDLVYKYDVGAW
jgi:hypothetical protein